MDQSYNRKSSPGNNDSQDLGGKSLNRGPKKQHLWEKADVRAQKNGAHRTIYWVSQKKTYEDGTFKGEKWKTSLKYIGDWKDNKKTGFGIQIYPNGDKYEGGWDNNLRNGQGTMWVKDEKGKLKREYTGDWENDKKSGRGTMFFKRGDRYDGFWLDNHPHGEGRMIYANGDVYEGQWHMGKRSGYGVLTKRSGDHFEGHWVNDLREGQGSYFFSEKNKIFVGEWVDDRPKAGVYSEVDDPSSIKKNTKTKFTEGYILPPIPEIKLADPTQVLQKGLEAVKRERTYYRARFVPLYELYGEEEIEELLKEFKTASNEREAINFTSLQALLLQMNINIEEDEIRGILKILGDDTKEDEISFQTFARMMAIILEQINTPTGDAGDAGEDIGPVDEKDEEIF